jgi:hypothetical protein
MTGVAPRDRCRVSLTRCCLSTVAAGLISGCAWTAETTCGVEGLVVNSPDRTDAALACEGARDAVAFLASHGLEVPPRIEIDIVWRLPDGAGHGDAAAGLYDEADRRALVLSYSAFEKLDTWFKVRIDRPLYRSLVSHEVAHAVADRNFKIRRPSIQAKEYVAYVTMLSTMAPELRERVLAEFPGRGFEGEGQMSSTIYLADPMRFGVMAYRHFSRQANGHDYLHAILAGKVLLDWGL